MMYDEGQDFMQMREEISQPQHDYWMDSENKIFEDESFPSPSTTPRIEEMIPDLEKVKVVELNAEEIQHLKLSMLENSNEYVPCIIAENKITKIIY